MIIICIMAPSGASYLGAYVRWRHLAREVGHGCTHLACARNDTRTALLISCRPLLPVDKRQKLRLR